MVRELLIIGVMLPPILQFTAWAVTSVHFCDSGANCTGTVPKVVGFIVVYCQNVKKIQIQNNNNNKETTTTTRLLLVKLNNAFYSHSSDFLVRRNNDSSYKAVCKLLSNGSGMDHGYYNQTLQQSLMTNDGNDRQ